jgi:hypothetical protein
VSSLWRVRGVMEEAVGMLEGERLKGQWGNGHVWDEVGCGRVDSGLDGIIILHLVAGVCGRL